MKARIGLIVAIFLGSLLHVPVTVLAKPDFSRIPRDQKFPDGISPSHVYARLDLLDRCLDVLLEQSRIVIDENKFPKTFESNLKPMHVYQCILICTWRLQTLNDQAKLGVKHIPTISADPRVYDPRDVFFIVDMMVKNVGDTGERMGIDLPTDESTFSDKTPTDVFNLGIRVFVKFSALCGYDQLSPNEVFAQMVRGVEDVKSILRQTDPACRYRIDAPPAPPGRIPGDVFTRCLEIRKEINVLRKSLGMDPIPIPPLFDRESIRPGDVFFQTQIIIAELNLLKKSLRTDSNSPLTIPATGKTPTNVYEQATMILYLLKQIKLPE